VGLEEAEDDPERILDDNAVPEDDRPERHRRHPVSVAHPAGDDGVALTGESGPLALRARPQRGGSADLHGGL
jgi:hypothetical protein